VQGVVRVMAKDYVRTKKYIQKFHEMKAQLQAVSLRMQTMKSQHAMSEAMKATSKAMVRMSRQMNLPQLQRVVRTFAMENERMELSQEVMSDTIDGVMDSEDDVEEEESIVQQVMQELNLADLVDGPAVPTTAGAVAASKKTAAAVASTAAAGGDLPPPPTDDGSAPPPSDSGGAAAGGGGGGGAAGGGGGGGGAPSLSELEARLANLRS
jgi:charged multivesicular body protein 2A